MIGHHTLYMSVLHCDDNTLPTWFQEVIASYVSILNNCKYSLTNHFSNARHLIADDARADAILAALQADSPQDTFSGAELAMLRYARKLTCACGRMMASDLSEMRQFDVDDGRILEVNQIVGYFNYANRSLNGLGVTLEGDVVGYYVAPEDREAKRVRANQDAVEADRP
jgi:uncharacterized peroxidase-related enzyme